MHNEVSAILEDKGTDVACVSPQSTVLQAVEAMNARSIGALLVTDGGKPVGIFTERDVLVRVVAAARDPVTTLVEHVMTRDIITIRPDTSVGDAMVLVTDKRCRHLPVVAGGKVYGMVSIGDLTRWVVRDQQNLIQDLETYVMRG